MRILYILVLILSLVSCSATLPVYYTKITGNAINVPLGGFENSNLNIISDENSTFDILLVKRSPLDYDALYLKCSHDSKPLSVTPVNIVCPVCSSTFDFDGAAKKAPATTALTRFPTELSTDKTTVRIDIQSLGL